MTKKIKVLFASYECAPFFKAGGLGDVAGSLPKSLKHQGIDIRVVLPLYKSIKSKFKDLEKIESNVKININKTEYKISVYRSLLPGSRVPVYFISHPIFDVDNIFDEYDRLRFALFSYFIVELGKIIGWKPDIIHANDWQVGLVPVLINKKKRSDKFYKKIKTFFTIHNIAFSGITKINVLKKVGLKLSNFKQPREDKINVMREGILNADIISTVSPTYAKEILTREFGYNLTPSLKKRSNDLYGIVNGLDYDSFNPQTDEHIKYQYSAKSLSNKIKNKLYLQKLSNLEVNKDIPLLGIVSRLTSQKGFDLLSEIFPELMKENLQIVLVGTGEERFEEFFKKMEAKYPDKFKANIEFSIKLASQIYAASDMFLMPSKYEPCGLGQLIAMKYGTVPIVRSTGGLKDTVKNYKQFHLNATGFAFKKYKSAELLKTIKRALNVYKNDKKWLILKKNTLKKDFSWDASAKKYITLYRSLIISK